jgi:hypothetical protein
MFLSRRNSLAGPIGSTAAGMAGPPRLGLSAGLKLREAKAKGFWPSKGAATSGVTAAGTAMLSRLVAGAVIAGTLATAPLQTQAKTSVVKETGIEQLVHQTTHVKEFKPYAHLTSKTTQRVLLTTKDPMCKRAI